LPLLTFILAGTDAGNPGTAPGVSLHGALEYLVKAGLIPEQALPPFQPPRFI